MYFTSIAEFNTYSDALAGLSFLSVKPSIEHAERRFLLPILGEGLYQDLQTKFTANTLSGKDQILFKKLQLALSSLTLYLYAPISEVQLSDNGLRRGHSEQMPGAFKYQVQEYRKAMLERGFEALEDAIAYLNANAADFSLWTNAPEFLSFRQLFIRTGSELQQYFTGIRFPRMLFLLLRSSMFNVQELTLAPAISTNIYKGLCSKYTSAAPNFTAEEKQLLDYVCRSLAHLTVARGLPVVVATLDEHGASILTGGEDAGSHNSKRAPASNYHLDNITKMAEDAGITWLDKAVDYLNTTASNSVFTSWYNAMQAATDTATDNSTRGGSFSL